MITVEVVENCSPGTFVTRLEAMDKDTTENLVFNLRSDSEHFYLDTIIGDVLTAGSLDREVQSMYALNVSVTDGVHTTYGLIRVSVGDVNDNSPVFSRSHYNTAVSQKAAQGSFVLRISASDPDTGYNGHVSYWMTGVSAERFVMDPESGVISVKNILTTSSEQIYNLTAYAGDHGIPRRISSTYILIYVNDSLPLKTIFKERGYDFQVREDARLNSILGIVELQSGSLGDVNLVISRADLSGLFDVLPSGDVVLIGTLDIESHSSHWIEVTSELKTDGTVTDSTSIRLVLMDVNDNTPVFLTDVSTLYMESPVSAGELVYQFVAVDNDVSSDNQAVRYSIETGSTYYFRIENVNGRVYTRRGLDTGSYILRVWCSDQGQPAMNNSLMVDVVVLSSSMSNRYPLFEWPFYETLVTENNQQEIVLWDFDIRINDRPPDYGILYNITKGDISRFGVSSTSVCI